jgi:hypothetical protein
MNAPANMSLIEKLQWLSNTVIKQFKISTDLRWRNENG